MSWDLLVCTADRPGPEALDALLAQNDALLADHDSDSVSCVVERRGRAGRVTPLFEVEHPVRVEPEDLPEVIATVAVGARWLVEIHCPSGAPTAARALATRFAKDLARTYSGAVLDPQEDVCIWPGRRPRPAPRRRSDEPRWEVELHWYVPMARSGRSAAVALLDSMRRTLPECLPRRFGDCEPFQYALPPDGDGEFPDFWASLPESTSSLGMLFWKTLRPAVDGWVSFASRPGPRRGGRGIECARVQVSLEGDALLREPRWAIAAAALFEAFASRASALYGCAVVARGPGVDLPYGIPYVNFRGLPRFPTWLAWFGPEYVPLVRASLDPEVARVHASGILWSGGAAPMDVRQLADVFPALPEELLLPVNPDGPGEPNFERAERLPVVGATDA